MGASEDFRSLIEFAIREEQKAQRLYRDLAKQTRDDYARAILEGLYEQEVHHENRLRALLASIDPART